MGKNKYNSPSGTNSGTTPSAEPAAATNAELAPVTGSTVDTEGGPSQPRTLAVETTAPAPTAEPVVEESAAVEELVEEPAPAAGSVSTLQANDQDATTLEIFRHQIDEYTAHMGRAVPVTREAGGQHQRRFFQLLERILKLQGTVFNRAWSDLLAKVDAERDGAFHELRAYRFMDHTKLDREQIRIFSNLMHLLISTANPQGRRQMLKLIDLASITKNIPIEGASDRIHAYYLI